MNDNEAKVVGELLHIGDLRMHTAIPLELLNEVAKRWNAYREMIDFLEKAEYVFNCAILRTPTGKVRSECTELNIARMQFIEESK